MAIMKTIQMNEGHQIILDGDFSHPSISKLVVSKNKNMYYARIGREYLHRIVICAKSGQMIDHINGNGLDNRLSNLRITTHQANKANQKYGLSRKTSKYTGVSKTKWGYHVSMKIKGKNKYIGKFSNELDAAHAYDLAAILLHGKYAALNLNY